MRGSSGFKFALALIAQTAGGGAAWAGTPSGDPVVVDSAKLAGQVTAVGAPPPDPCASPAVPAPRSGLDFFTAEEPLAIELQADFAYLNRQDDDTTTLPGTLTHPDHGVQRRLSIEIEPRGKSRRGFCDFKPLKLRFDGQEYKVVTHCTEAKTPKDRHAADQRVVLEQTFYQALNALEVPSLRTRLLRVTYRNPKGRVVANAYAFVLEPEKDLAERLGAKRVKQDKTFQAYNKMNPSHRVTVDFFNRLIENSDPGAVNHAVNSFLLKREDEVVAAVPYDFDLTSFALDGKYGGYQPWHDPQTDTAWMSAYLKQKPEHPGYVAEVRRRMDELLTHQQAALQVVETSRLDPAMKKRVKARFEAFFRAATSGSAPGYSPSSR